MDRSTDGAGRNFSFATSNQNWSVDSGYIRLTASFNSTFKGQTRIFEECTRLQLRNSVQDIMLIDPSLFFMLI
jgi:hypothetical protein